MVTLDDEVLVLDRTRDGDDILPLVLAGKGGRGGGWYIDIGIADEDVLNRLLDAEILDEELLVRYIARTGQQTDARMHIDELISDAEGHRCRLRGTGPTPPAIVGDEPRMV